jgi:outer membrane protein OmpA-like peptidoglycan-associated protein
LQPRFLSAREDFAVMSIKPFLPLALLTLPALAAAQAPPDPIKTAEQITCELTRDCEAVPAPTRKAAETRGFAIAKQKKPAEPAYIAPAPSKRPAAPGVAKPKVRAPASAKAAVPATGARLAVGFETNSFALNAAGRRQADQLLAALKGPKLAGRKVIVSGHTDSVGDRAANLELSRRRAAALVDYLAANGIERTRLEAKGFGFDKPLPGISPRAGAQRRVEIMLAN